MKHEEFKSKAWKVRIAEEKDKLEKKLPHMSLTDTLDRMGVKPGEIIQAEWHYLGAIGTTWLKVHRQSNGQGMICQPLSLSPQVIKLGGRDLVVQDVTRGRNPERLESWFTQEALKLPDRFTGRTKKI